MVFNHEMAKGIKKTIKICQIMDILKMKKSIVLVAALFSFSFSANAIAQDAWKQNFANLALKCVKQEYPNHISHTLKSAQDAKEPHELYPAFYGCLDWHSSVHGHWLLAKVSEYHYESGKPVFLNDALSALQKSITPENIAKEVEYLKTPGRASFERPYGLAWALMLDKELRVSPVKEIKDLQPIYSPLAKAARDKITAWLPKLDYPIRTGEHSQTAFGLSLSYDWAEVANDIELQNLIKERAMKYYKNDVKCPLNYEPDGEAFLSPCLEEAALMARIMPKNEYNKWLVKFLPQIPNNGKADWLIPAKVSDRSDPKIAHLDGLNLSRAAKMNIIASYLNEQNYGRYKSLMAAAKAHADASLPFITGEHYEGGHWLGTFATYYLSNEGVHYEPIIVAGSK